MCLNLKRAFEGSTVFFITHRLSTIRTADIILMMDSGNLVEQGNSPTTHRIPSAIMLSILSRNLTLTKSNQNSNNPLVDSSDPSPGSSRSSFTPWEGSSIFVSRAIIGLQLHLLSALLLGSGFIFAFLAKIDQTISVRGELQPAASVNDVQSPSTGVVKEIFVSEGDRVAKGSPLLSVEASGLLSQAQSLNDSIILLELESESLNGVISSNGDPALLRSLPILDFDNDSFRSEKMVAARNQVQQIISQLIQIDLRLNDEAVLRPFRANC